MIRITIEAPRGGGKTVCAFAIKMALEKLGATVEVRDDKTTRAAIERRQAAIDEREPMLRGAKVQIDTFLPPGVGG